MKSGVLSRNTSEGGGWRLSFTSAVFPLIVTAVALLFGAILGTFDASKLAFVVGAIILVIVVALRQNELAATMIVAAHLYIDWYLGLELVAQVVAVGLLFLFFLARSPQRPWVAPQALWLWCLFLVLTIAPVLRGAQGLYDLAYYYPNIIFGALVAFWLGMVVANNRIRLRTLFKMLAGLGTLLSIHTLFQAMTGTLLFGTSRFDAFLLQVSDFALANSTAQRIGSFFVNPDWNGTFFAMIFFLPLALFVESPALLEKLLYLVEMFLTLVALLFTYSNGAWIGVFAGIIVFVFFVGRAHYRILILFFLIIVAIGVTILFPAQINLQFQHATDPTELSLRLGAWQTALRVINAFPLTGVGLGIYVYEQRAEPYRVPAQYLPLSHPHNAYLELGAMAGLPVLLVFVALQLFALWQAWRNWILLDERTRSLLSGGIAAVIALSINSLSINGWTLPPLAAVGWLILGAIASPLIMRKQLTEEESHIP